jgi:hypothetical protein
VSFPFCSLPLPSRKLVQTQRTAPRWLAASTNELAGIRPPTFPGSPCGYHLRALIVRSRPIDRYYECPTWSMYVCTYIQAPYCLLLWYSPSCNNRIFPIPAQEDHAKRPDNKSPNYDRREVGTDHPKRGMALASDIGRAHAKLPAEDQTMRRPQTTRRLTGEGTGRLARASFQEINIAAC